MGWKALDDMDLRGKRVLVRVDINVPVENGKVTDDTRIQRIIPTLRDILEQGGTPVLLAHFGRPKGKRVQDLSLRVVLPALEAALGRKVVLAETLEAAEAGASAVLLIARALDDEEMAELRRVADLAGLDCLYEAHDEAEIGRILDQDPMILGVNNRNLSTFETDLAVTERLLPLIPDHVVKVSESGIAEPEDAWRARDAGADAVLCGEALMRAGDIEGFVAAMKEA